MIDIPTPKDTAIEQRELQADERAAPPWVIPLETLGHLPSALPCPICKGKGVEAGGERACPRCYGHGEVVISYLQERGVEAYGARIWAEKMEHDYYFFFERGRMAFIVKDKELEQQLATYQPPASKEGEPQRVVDLPSVRKRARRRPQVAGQPRHVRYV